MRKLFAALAIAAAGLGVSAPAQAQDLLESYGAYISWADVHNSKGVRLWEPWQILRQDRANFHKFGIRDDVDDWDSFFSSYNNRATMEQMIMRGYIDPVAAQQIVNGDALIRVSIWGYNGVGQKVTVDVYR